MLNASAIRNGHGTAHEIQHTQCNPLEPDEQCYKSSMAFLVEQNSKNWVESFEWANVSLNRCSFSNIFDQSISAFEHFVFFLFYFSVSFFFFKSTHFCLSTSNQIRLALSHLRYCVSLIFGRNSFTHRISGRTEKIH